MNETENVATQEATETNPETEVVRNSPTAEQFIRIWNESDSRKDALARFANAGYTVTYSAMVAREKSFRGRGYPLKEIASSPRGKKLPSAEEMAALLAASK